MSRSNEFVKVFGYLSAPPTEQPTSLEACIAHAVVEHLLFHWNDGVSLFVFIATDRADGKQHVYPISAMDARTAFQIALALHDGRGLPSDSQWELIVEYPDPNDARLVA